VLRDWVRGRANGSAAVDVPVVAIDDDFRGVADQEEVPVDNCDEDTATDDVAEGGGDHALPDVKGNALQKDVSQKSLQRAAAHGTNDVWVF
jgi:hypothetical protein